jgi:hypothetical protein
MSLIKEFCNLPIDLVKLVIDFTGLMTYRNGKFINKIQKNDERYESIKINEIIPLYLQHDPLHIYEDCVLMRIEKIHIDTNIITYIYKYTDYIDIIISKKKINSFLCVVHDKQKVQLH